MSEKLYFVGLTSISEFLNSHEKDQPLFYSIGRTRNRRRSRNHTRKMDGLLFRCNKWRLSLLPANNRLYRQNQRRTVQP